MSEKKEYTVSAKQLMALKDAADELKRFLDRKDEKKVESQTRVVRAALGRMLRTMTFAEQKVRGERVVFQRQWFVNIPDLMDRLIADLTQIRRQKPKTPEHAADVKRVTIEIGDKVHGLLQREFAQLGISEYRLR